jgi:hypothetical protein
MYSMHRPRAGVAIGLCTCMVLLPCVATAVPAGSIGLYSSPERTHLGACFGLDRWQPFDGHLFVWPGGAGTNAFEASFTLPPDLVLMGVELQAPFTFVRSRMTARSPRLLGQHGGGRQRSSPQDNR